MKKSDALTVEEIALVRRLLVLFTDEQRFADLERLFNSVPRARSFAWTDSQRKAVIERQDQWRAEGQAGPPTDRNAVRHVG